MPAGNAQWNVFWAIRASEPVYQLGRELSEKMFDTEEREFVSESKAGMKPLMKHQWESLMHLHSARSHAELELEVQPLPVCRKKTHPTKERKEKRKTLCAREYAILRIVEDFDC